MTEAEQVRRAKDRDPTVWSLWYDTYYDSLYRYAYARLGLREEAEDTASEVFLQALRNIDRFNYTGRPVLAWLYGIAHNLVSQRLRRRARSNRASAALSVFARADSAVVPGPQSQVDEQVDLRDAIASLSPDQQNVIVLRFFLSLSTRETARLLDKRENAVFALQFRALAALRRHLLDRQSTAGRSYKPAAKLSPASPATSS